MPFEQGKWHSHYGLISFVLLNTHIPKTGKASRHWGSKRDVATNGFVQKVGIHQISMTVLTMGMTMNNRIPSAEATCRPNSNCDPNTSAPIMDRFALFVAQLGMRADVKKRRRHSGSCPVSILVLWAGS